MGQTSRRRGSTFAEMVLSIGLIAIVILGISLLSLTVLRARNESSDRVAAATVANTLLDRIVREAQSDPSFWAGDYSTTPYASGEEEVGGVVYAYSLLAQTVTDSVGDEIGNSLSNNRLKMVVIEISWMDTEVQDRQGYGKLSFSASRLVAEVIP